MATIAERVARRYIEASTPGPFDDELKQLPDLIQTFETATATYQEALQRLTDIQTAVDSVPLGRLLKKLQKGLARLAPMADQTKRIATEVTELNRTFVREVDRADAASRVHSDKEYDHPNLRTKVGPLLGETNKMVNALATWTDWLPTGSDVEEIDSSLESRKLSAIQRKLEKVPDLSEAGDPVSVIAEYLNAIDENFEDAVNERAD